MTLFTTIAFFAVAQGIFLSIVLFFLKRGNKRANTYLALLILFFSLWVAEFAAYFTQYLYEVPHLLFSTVGLPWLFGPFLLFYAQSLHGEKPSRDKWFGLHFVPFLLYILYLSPFYLQNAAFKTQALELLRDIHEPPKFTISFYISKSLKLLHLVIYILFTYFYLKKTPPPFIKKRLHRLSKLKKFTKAFPHKNNRTAQNGTLMPFYNRWLKKLILGIGLFVLFDLLHFLGLLLFQYDYLFVLGKIILLLGAAMVYFIGYATLHQPEIISGDLKFIQKVNTAKPLEKKQTLVRYQKSSLDEKKAAFLVKTLLQTMEKEKPWLNSELKLNDLANQLNISTHHLSQLLNEHLGKKFFDFINEYRVQAAQGMLINPKFSHFTILSIAFEAGFKNKATFNTAFKKYSKMTPSQYKKRFFVSKS